MGLGGFLKKVGKAVGKGLGAVEKATRPVHGIARSVASGAANAVAPGSGQLVAAFTGAHRGAAGAGGVGGMLPQLGQITGINVAQGKPFNFLPGVMTGVKNPATSPEVYQDRGMAVLDKVAPQLSRAARAAQRSAQQVFQQPRRMTVGYQGDSPPLMASHRQSNVLLLPGGQVRKKYKRMNVANTRALSRSIRRVKGFEKLARRVVNMNVGKRFKKKGRRR